MCPICDSSFECTQKYLTKEATSWFIYVYICLYCVYKKLIGYGVTRQLCSYTEFYEKPRQLGTPKLFFNQWVLLMVVNSRNYGLRHGLRIFKINNNLRGLFGYHTVQGKPQQTSPLGLQSQGCRLGHQPVTFSYIFLNIPWHTLTMSSSDGFVWK